MRLRERRRLVGKTGIIRNALRASERRRLGHVRRQIVKVDRRVRRNHGQNACKKKKRNAKDKKRKGGDARNVKGVNFCGSKQRKSDVNRKAETSS